MAKMKFKAPVMRQFEIMEGNSKIGTLRVRPNAIRWKAADKKQFRSVTIQQFAEFAEAHGTITKS